MKPFDLATDNLDQLHAALCPSVEVRESYLANPPDDDDHERVDIIEQQPQRPEPLPPGRFIISQPQQHPQPRVDGSFIFGVRTPLRARTEV